MWLSSEGPGAHRLDSAAPFTLPPHQATALLAGISSLSQDGCCVPPVHGTPTVVGLMWGTVGDPVAWLLAVGALAKPRHPWEPGRDAGSPPRERPRLR